MGCVIPSFGDYLYYYQMDVTGFTKFQYAILIMIGFLTLITGSLLFNVFFKKTNFKLIITGGCLINLIGSVLTLLFVRQIYLGMSPMVFVACTSTVTDTLS